MRKKCTYCGADLPGDASFCPHCAKSLIEKTEAAPPRLWRKKAARGLIYALILAVTTLGGVMVHQRLSSENVDIPEAGSLLSEPGGAVPVDTVGSTGETDVSSEPAGEPPTEALGDSVLPPDSRGYEETIASLQNYSATAGQQQMIADAVTAEVHSEKFAAWQASYRKNTRQDPRPPEVIDVLHYWVPDFEGEEMECYLMVISADVCYGGNQEGSHYELFVSVDGTQVYDSITADTLHYRGDVSTYERRAAYLLWILGCMIDGNYHSSGYFLNDTERVIQWSADEVAVINSSISERT